MSIIDKFLDVMRLNDDDYEFDNEDYDYDEEEDYEVKEKKPSRRERKKEEEQQQTAATFDISENYTNQPKPPTGTTGNGSMCDQANYH